MSGVRMKLGWILAALLCGAVAVAASAGIQTSQAPTTQAATTRTAPAAQQNPAAARTEEVRLWGTYIEGASSATQADDLGTAEILLRASMDLAKQMGTRNMRLYISGTLLSLNLQDQGLQDNSDAVFRDTPQLNQPKYGPDLLPIATELENMANHRYDVWQKQRDNKEKQANTTLETAAGYERLALDIRRLNLPESDRILAGTEGFYGLMLTKEERAGDFTKDISDLYDSALKRYEAAEKEGNQRNQNSRHFSLVTAEDSAVPKESDDGLVMRVLQAKQYTSLGDLYKSAGKVQQAREAYSMSAKYYSSVVDAMKKQWADHPNTIYQRYALAEVLIKEGSLEEAEHKDAQASAYRKEAMQNLQEVTKYYLFHRDLYGSMYLDTAAELGELETEAKKAEEAGKHTSPSSKKKN